MQFRASPSAGSGILRVVLHLGRNEIRFGRHRILYEVDGATLRLHRRPPQKSVVKRIVWSFT